MAAEPVPDELRSVVERSSGRMTSDTTADTLLRLLTSVAQRIVPAAAGAGLTVAGPGAAAVSLVPTHGQVELLDSFQYALDEGPCLTAWRNRIVTRVDDVTTEQRWPPRPPSWSRRGGPTAGRASSPRRSSRRYASVTT
jgi:hypothetical protein